MRREFAFAVFGFLAASLAAGQQAAPPTSPVPAATPPAPQTVYYAGPGVTAPELLPITLTGAATGRCKKVDGTAVLSVIVDAKGEPRDVYFVRPIGNDLDKLALNMVAADRFKPGSHDGTPAAVAISDEISMGACVTMRNNEAGQTVDRLLLRSAPGQKLDLQPPPAKDATPTLSDSPSQSPVDLTHRTRVDDQVTPPVVLKVVHTIYSDKAREEKVQGVCLIWLIVDANGMPQNLRVWKSVEPSLDQNALNAVSQYRFKPAMKNGLPVPAMISIEVDFHLN